MELAISLLAALLAGIGAQQSAPMPAPARPAGIAAQPPGQPNYQIGPQDELRVTVFDAEGLSGVYRVDDDGYITFPLLGRIHLGGTALSAAAEQLRRMLM